MGLISFFERLYAKIMKKILSLALALITVFSLVGCNKYKPVRSTREESRVVMTVTVGGEEYDIKYELYRALFLNHKSTVDGGDDSVWSGNDAQKYIDEINKIIVSRASEIFAVFSLAEKLGFKPFSKDVDKEITSRIEMSVDGNGGDVVGFGGDYDAYLASLKNQNLNYSVQTMMLRYSIMLEEINEYYLGFEDPAVGYVEGEHSFTKEDVKSFYESDSCVRILHAFVGKNKMADAKGRIDDIRDDIIAAESATDIALIIINRTTVVTSDVLKGKEVSGIVIGENTISYGVYDEYRDAAFALNPGEVSEVIEIAGSEPGYYVIYALEKNSEHFELCYESIKNAYLDNVIGNELGKLADEAAGTVEYTKKYSDIDHKNITMN